MPITRATESICTECGVKSTAWIERRDFGPKHAPVVFLHRRDYMPTTYVIRLTPDTNTTYIVTPEVEEFLRALPFSKVRSLDSGKQNYAFDTPLQGQETVALWRLLDADARIEKWHTVVLVHGPDEDVAESARVCASHVDFGGRRIAA